MLAQACSCMQNAATSRSLPLLVSAYPHWQAYWLWQQALVALLRQGMGSPVSRDWGVVVSFPQFCSALPSSILLSSPFMFFGQSLVSPVSRDWGVRAVACLEGAPSYTMTLSAR